MADKIIHLRTQDVIDKLEVSLRDNLGFNVLENKELLKLIFSVLLGYESRTDMKQTDLYDLHRELAPTDIILERCHRMVEIVESMIYNNYRGTRLHFTSHAVTFVDRRTILIKEYEVPNVYTNTR